jgi:uncharacterized protein YdeI (YjbR/CyaY-like superfamily)
MRMVKARDEATWFPTAAAWRGWLEANHDSATELWVGISKKHVEGGLSYSEAVDEALCFGWIDGIAHGVDEDGYMQRFTPRKRSSIWSAVNLGKMDRLIAEGRVHEVGLRAWEERDPVRQGLYSFEQPFVRFDEAMLERFRSNETAWTWFESQPPGYQRQAAWWVTSAKRPETRDRRLAKLIEESANARRVT